jgi:hypothetical protein
MSGRVNRLVQALRCSQDMLGSARDQRWNELSALESQRAALLREYAAAAGAPVHAGDAEMEAELLARIIVANDEIITLGECHRRELADAISGNRRRRHAAYAYSDTSRR